MDDVASLRAALWKAGYRPVPVYTRDKKPEGLDWTTRARRDPPDCLARPTSPRALSTGVLCDGLRAIDIDVSDLEIAAQIEDLARTMLGDAPCRERDGTGKRLLLYWAADGQPRKRHVTSADKLDKIEALGLGQQFVAYGVHPEGMDYEWRGGTDLLKFKLVDLTAVSEDQLTAFLNAGAAIIGAPTEAEREEAKAAPVASARETPLARPGSASDARLTRYAAETMTRIASELARAQAGQRNGELNNAAMRLGSMAANGWIDESACHAALTAACRSNGLGRADGMHSVEATFRSGWRAGLARPAASPADTPEAANNVVIALKPRSFMHENGVIADSLTGEIVGEYARPAEPGQAGLADDMTRVPGLVGQVVEWICSTARQPNRPLALAAALVTVGTLLGLRLAGPTGSGTHLYVLALAPTGAGKQHPQNCVRRLLKAAGKGDYNGPPAFRSDAGLIRTLVERRVSVSCQDEYGSFLRRVNSRKAASHERGISEIMRNLWGLSFEPYTTPMSAAVASAEIGSVCFSLLGSSTVDDMMAALSGDDVSNGFVNRFLVIDGGPRGEECEPMLDARDVPGWLAEGLAQLPFGDRLIIGRGADPEPHRAAWDHEAKAVYADLKRRCHIRNDGSPGEYFARTAEMALRVATIVAAGVNCASPKIDRLTMEWAADIVMGSHAWMAKEAESRMTEELGAAQLEIRVRQKLAKGPMSMRDLHRQLYRHVRNADDLKRIIAAMQDAGVLQGHKVQQSRGPQALTYALTA